MMTTRSQPRRRKVRQELVGTVPPRLSLSPPSQPTGRWKHPLPSLVALLQDMISVQGQLWEKVFAGFRYHFGGSRWSRAQVEAEQEPGFPCNPWWHRTAPSLWVVSAVVDVGSVWPGPGQAEMGRGGTSAVTIAAGRF